MSLPEIVKLCLPCEFQTSENKIINKAGLIWSIFTSKLDDSGQKWSYMRNLSRLFSFDRAN